MRKVLRILGIRGVPAAHGGFETFAEKLALHLVQQGWRVVVYCQDEGTGPIVEDNWEGVERVRIPVAQTGPRGTIVFDWKATAHAARHRDLCLTLGYNTAAFCARLRLKGIPNLINMDGIEWARAKWGPLAKTWFWLNERAGCWLGDHLVADHPQIKAHLQTRVAAGKITTIAYGAEAVTAASAEPVQALGLQPGRFLTVIGRAEPENSILEVVRGFSMKPRGHQLVVLGKYDPDNIYHRAIKSAASPEVRFVGAIYDKAVVHALRFHSAAYVHGHQVGGTNPSLVEALGAGNPVVAHDNQFNRWVAGDAAVYFSDAETLSARMDELLSSPARLETLRSQSLLRFNSAFTWFDILSQYERLLERYQPNSLTHASGFRVPPVRPGLAAAGRAVPRAHAQKSGWHLPELGRFLSVGVVNMVVGLLVIYACKWFFHAGDVAANAIGYGVGLCTSFALNSRWTFSYKGPQFPALGKFLAVAAVAYAMNLLTVLVAIRYLGMNDYLAQALGIPPYTVTTYLASKFIVFRLDPKRKNSRP